MSSLLTSCQEQEQKFYPIKDWRSYEDLKEEEKHLVESPGPDEGGGGVEK